MAPKTKLTITKFVKEGAESAVADLVWDGVVVGSVERVSADEFVSLTSRARQWRVSHYEATFNDRAIADVTVSLRRVGRLGLGPSRVLLTNSEALSQLKAEALEALQERQTALAATAVNA